MSGELDEFLADASTRSSGDRVSLTIRDFLAKWGAKRRGYWIVDSIQRDLERHNLATIPSFEVGWIDNYIRLVPLESEPTTPSGGLSPEVPLVDATSSAQVGATLRVSSLESASQGVVSVTRNDDLARAQSLMMKHDYSQLAVLSGVRDLQGAVSWESIAQARMHRADPTLVDTVVHANYVGLDDDLLSQIPRIIDSGFVFVRGRDRCICGVVTTADLAVAFETLAGPFLLVGEVERRLRRIIDRTFTLDQLRSIRDPDDTERQVTSAKDLTLGEYIRLLEAPERWNSLAWDVDRKVFLTALQTLRALRNEIMHFSPDPAEAETVSEVRNLLKWLKLVEP